MSGPNRRMLEDIADDLLESVPVLMRRISRQGSKKFDPSRFVLRAVWKHGPVRMSEIGKHMGVSKPYMTLLVNRLIDDGLVSRVPDKRDRRVINITITEKGRKVIEAFMRDARETVIRNLSSLDSKDVRSLHESMRMIRTIISKLDRNEKGSFNAE